MPRNYKRKTERQSWNEISMEKAIASVMNNEMGWLRASKVFGVPLATLRRHFEKRNKTIAPASKGMGRYKKVFSDEMEREIVDHIKLFETRLFGFTPTQVLKLAYQYADINKIPHNFNNEKKMAGPEWLAGFRRRNPDISLRKPEATSAARAQAFNKPQVNLFFNTYQDIMNSNKIPPHRVYNVDESAISTVQKPQKVFATTGRKQVGALTSAEKGSHVTVVCCMNEMKVYITGQGKRKPRKKPTVLLLTSTPNMEETKIKSAPPPVSKKRVRKVTKALNFSSSSDEDCPCIYCNDLFSRSKPKEVWLQCLSCKKWAHASCADVPKKITSFICELCQ